MVARGGQAELVNDSSHNAQIQKGIEAWQGAFSRGIRSQTTLVCDSLHRQICY